MFRIEIRGNIVSFDVYSEMKTDPRWTKSTELIQQNRVLLNEIEKQKFDKLNLIEKSEDMKRFLFEFSFLFV